MLAPRTPLNHAACSCLAFLGKGTEQSLRVLLHVNCTVMIKSIQDNRALHFFRLCTLSFPVFFIVCVCLYMLRNVSNIFYLIYICIPFFPQLIFVTVLLSDVPECLFKLLVRNGREKNRTCDGGQDRKGNNTISVLVSEIRSFHIVKLFSLLTVLFFFISSLCVPQKPSVFMEAIQIL